MSDAGKRMKTANTTLYSRLGAFNEKEGSSSVPHGNSKGEIRAQ